ncbi:MAG: response regulator [Spirochaetes bacterium]|nr:response regulator [Spirochaetota bacterium]
MSAHYDNGTGGSVASREGYVVFESMNQPVTIIGRDGSLLYGNGAYRKLVPDDGDDTRLDWQHPFFPEYRARIARAYLDALGGEDARCFAVLDSRSRGQIPVEICLFPMYAAGAVASIVVIMIIIEDRLLSFDPSTLSAISENNFRYDNLYFEFSPMPVIRVDGEMHIVRCSHSMEGFTGYTCREILEEKGATLEVLFGPESDRIKKTAGLLLAGESPFQRIGEVNTADREGNRKVVNLTLYPIIEEGKITALEMIMEDITRIKELQSRVNTANRASLFTDITKGFLHSLNNTINVILSKTQLLMQITEKESVMEGIQVMEESAMEIAGQVKRIQNFIVSAHESGEDTVEPIVDVIEDAIEFSKMQFKVYNIDNTKRIEVDKKYYSGVLVNTKTRLLREIITSIILKVSDSIQKAGAIHITLRQNADLSLAVEARKDTGTPPAPPSFINIFTGADIRQVADIIGLKIIEEESPESYAIKVIFPPPIIIRKEKRESEAVDYRIRDLDIMIVEDEIPLQKILFELFDKMGNRVFICDDGKKAIEEFKRTPYDILITDYGIPGITGIELAARIKEIKEDTITILLSGWMLDSVKPYRNVIDLFLPKPFKLDVLLKKIARAMSERK